MAKTVYCDIVSAEEKIFSGEVTMVSAAATTGDLGVMPGHAPMLTGLQPGPVRITRAEGPDEIYYVSGGYLEVQPNHITVLADTALRAGDMDEAAAEQARKDAERELADQSSEIDYGRAQAHLAEAMAQLRTIQKIRKKAR
ncbi:MAG: F0F1 ATP synthase subunit epsilon [Halomonadaceae bacterium]|nr:MAG: F0F1 ATP synthase subunit epsilon [Halomonadaceae bacterium]